MDELENPHGISREQAARFREDFELLDESRQGLAADVLGYVLRGENEEVLKELEETADGWKQLRLITSQGLHYQNDPIRESRLEMLRNWETGDGTVPYRLGRVMWAALRPVMNWVKYPLGRVDFQWMTVLLREGSGHGPPPKEEIAAAKVGWTVADWEKILVAAGKESGDLLGFVAIDCGYWLSSAIDTIEGLSEWLSRRLDEFLPFMDSPDDRVRINAESALRSQRVPLHGEVLRRIAGRMVGGKASVREDAAGWLKRHAADFKEVAECVRGFVETGKATERRQSVALVTNFMEGNARSYLQEWLEKDKTKSVRDEIELVLQSMGDREEGSQEFELPEARSFESEVVLTEEMVAELKSIIARVNEVSIEKYAEWWDQSDPRFRNGPREMEAPFSAEKTNGMIEALKSPGRCRQGGVFLRDIEMRWGDEEFRRLLDAFAEKHEFGWVGQIRVMWIEGLLHGGYWSARWVDRLGMLFELDPEMTLVDLAAAFEAAGVGEDVVLSFYLRSWSFDETWNDLELPDEKIWPLFARRIDAVEKVLGIGKVGGKGGSYAQAERKRGYLVLETFPHLPTHLLPFLWVEALAGGKTERAMAQRCVAGERDRDERIIAALSDRRKGVREVAAEWAGRLRLEAAEKSLRKAVAKEKEDEPKAAMMEALEKLGVDVDQFLDRKALLAEAEKGLKKALPKGLDWFPFNTLPPVRWAKNRQQVPTEVLKWLLVQAVKLKKPEPGPLLRRYVEMMDGGERKALGRFILQSWLVEDVPKGAKAGDQWNSDYKPHSAIDSKGLLAFCGAACGKEVLPLVSDYLKAWYGWRPAQCKSLLRMASWIESPVVVQYLFEISNRFRTRSIQKEAAAIIEEVAERRGWTRGELADRTIPSGGFDEQGMLEIDYGKRRFSARLMEDFSIQLKNDEGKVLKALPAARVGESEDDVKAQKQAFSKAKKELKQAAKMLEERLYEAMCLERRWTFRDWDLFLNRHPVAGRFCQRLVWAAGREGEPMRCFRPLADRSLSDVDDNEVVLEADEEVRLAHSSFLPEEVGESWQRHFEDYEILPLFTQFGHLPFTLGEELEKAKSLDEFEGHMIGAFDLRRIAKKLGFRRGPTEDGGWFHSYERPFPGLKMQAVLEISGNRLPEDDEELALHGLSFVPVSDENSSAGRAIRLGDLPEVLVGEMWNHLRIIAAEGSGFEPEWKKLVGY